jgi:hypothetical protein
MGSFSMRDGYNRYLFAYRHDDSEWGIEIVANSPQDAHERLKAIRWAHFKGEIAAKIPVPGGSHFRRLLSRKRVPDSRGRR